MSEGAKGVESFHTQASKKDATWPSARVVATDNFRRVSESYYGISPVDGFSPGAYLGGKPSKSSGRVAVVSPVGANQKNC